MRFIYCVVLTAILIGTLAASAAAQAQVGSSQSENTQSENTLVADVQAAVVQTAGAQIAEAQIADAQIPDGARLVGIWKVDLRPTPDAEAYFQTMEIRSVDGLEISGSFYGTEFREGRINTDWGAVRFAFVTEDGSGAYYSSGTLDEEGRMEGLTLSIGRKFLAYWSAERSAKSAEE